MGGMEKPQQQHHHQNAHHTPPSPSQHARPTTASPPPPAKSDIQLSPVSHCRSLSPQQPQQQRGGPLPQQLLDDRHDPAHLPAQPIVYTDVPPGQPPARNAQPQQQPPPVEHYPARAQQQQSCAFLVRAVKWIPVLFIMTIIGWSYYAYVWQLCIMSVQTIIEKILFLFFYHVVFIMFFWSYWQTVFTNVASVPAKFRLSSHDLQRLARAETAEAHKRILETFARDLPISNRTYNGSVRFCDKCLLVKPDRAHHCSVCGQCVLKMDHHCPWVNNCVNFYNYKYFVLFLGYALLYCIYVALTSLRYFVLFWEGSLTGGMGRFHILFLFFVAVMFAVSLVSLFGYHVYLVMRNRTTLEAFRAPVFRVGGADKNGFHLGRYNNLQEVFGDNRKHWFVPVFSSLGNGYAFPLPEHQRNVQLTYDSMGATATTATTALTSPTAPAPAPGNAIGPFVASNSNTSSSQYTTSSESSNSLCSGAQNDENFHNNGRPVEPAGQLAAKALLVHQTECTITDAMATSPSLLTMQSSGNHTNDQR